MRRWLMAIACVGLFALLAAGEFALPGTGGASATVTYDTGTGAWFIPRGVVIRYVGRSGLVANPVVIWQASSGWKENCDYADGTHVVVSFVDTPSFEYVAQPIYAKTSLSAAQDQYGKRIITGYFAGVHQIMGMNPSVYPPRACYDEQPNANGSPWVGSSDLTSTTPYTETLTFQGVTIPAPYAYIWGRGAGT